MSFILNLIPKPILLFLVAVMMGLLGVQAMVTARVSSKLATAEITLAVERAVAAEAAASAAVALAEERKLTQAAIITATETYHERIAEADRIARDNAAAADRLRNALAKARTGGHQEGSAAALAAERASRAAVETVALQCLDRYRGLDEVTRRVHATAERCASEYDAHALNGGSD